MKWDISCMKRDISCMKRHFAWNEKRLPWNEKLLPWNEIYYFAWNENFLPKLLTKHATAIFRTASFLNAYLALFLAFCRFLKCYCLLYCLLLLNPNLAFTGQTAPTQAPTLPCDSNPCLNSGQCFTIADNTGYFCLCSSEFTGTTCETSTLYCRNLSIH